MGHKEKDKWIKVKQEEKSLYDNQTYGLVDILKGKKGLKNNWVFQVKHEETSSWPRY